MTQTKWIDVNGNLYKGTIETVQNWDGSENRDFVFATVIINVLRFVQLPFYPIATIRQRLIIKNG